jgi:hypothetical protein
MTRRVLFVCLFPLIVLFGLGASPVIAQSQANAVDKAQLSISDPARAAKGHLTLRATLTSAAGRPLGDRTVDFYQRVQLFGDREALIGTGTTDSTGYVAIDYQPVEDGSQMILVRFHGDPVAGSAEASATIQVRDSIPVYAPPPLPLAGVRQWLPLGLATLVLATWAVLIGVTARAIFGIKGARRQQQPHAETAFVFAPKAQEGSNS